MAEQLYIYPAIFTSEAGGAISVHFPDLLECITCGEDETDALYSAQEALELCLLTREEDNESIPTATSARDLKTEYGQVVVLVQANMILARAESHNKSVRKNCTLPQWLDELAEREHVNYSQVLQHALMDLFGVDGCGKRRHPEHEAKYHAG
ncbi:MAG: type II toxin-antitoxin system HicB family antitoxin [bacterium]